MMIIPTLKTLPDPRISRKALFDLNNALERIPGVLRAICGNYEVALIITSPTEAEPVFCNAKPILKDYLGKPVHTIY